MNEDACDVMVFVMPRNEKTRDDSRVFSFLAVILAHCPKD